MLLQLIEWFIFDRRINTKESIKFKINNIIVESKGITSELVINDITERDFINYTCKASNVYGYSKYQIQMKPDGELERSCEIKFIFSKLI